MQAQNENNLFFYLKLLFLFCIERQTPRRYAITNSSKRLLRMEKVDYQKKWAQCLDIIRDNIGQERFNTWFKCAKAVDFTSDNRLVILLPSQFFYEKYEDDFYQILNLAIRKVFGPSVGLEYEVGIIRDDESAHVTLPSNKQSPLLKNKLEANFLRNPVEKREPDFDPQLNPALNFENYCVGESNRLPFTIAEYIANHPEKSEFNPCFLYGSVGVGKTHLIQSIGIRLKERNPQLKVLYMPTRQFQQLYQNAFLHKEIPDFINWFQQMDVLILDDLQEIAGKKGTVDVLFPIFNHLHQNKKKLIFSCDRPPKDLDGITDRLIDRFKWGITEELQRPDFELRKKILKSKAIHNGLDLSDEVIDMIAARATGSVRELEGIVMGLLTRSIATNRPITPQLAHEVISQNVKVEVRKNINFDMIVEVTAEYYGLNSDSIFSKNRMRDIAEARQMIMYMSSKHIGLSSVAIGQKLNRKHATVLYGINAIEERLPYSKELTDAVSLIENELFK